MIEGTKIKAYMVTEEVLNMYYDWLPIKVRPHNPANRFFRPAQLVKAMGAVEYVRQFLVFYDEVIKDGYGCEREKARLAVARQAKFMEANLKPKSKRTFVNKLKERKFL